MLETDLNPHIERAIDGFNNHDAAAFASEFAKEGTFYDPPQEEKLTGTEIREYVAGVLEAFPDVDWEFDTERPLTSDEGATALEWTFYATQEGSFEDIPATGNPCEIPGVTVVTVSEDGITSWRDYWDRQLLAEQLGLE